VELTRRTEGGTPVPIAHKGRDYDITNMFDNFARTGFALTGRCWFRDKALSTFRQDSLTCGPARAQARACARTWRASQQTRRKEDRESPVHVPPLAGHALCQRIRCCRSSWVCQRASLVRDQHGRAACGVLHNPCQQLQRDLPVMAHTEPVTQYDATGFCSLSWEGSRRQVLPIIET